MKRPFEVTALANHKIMLKYADGVEGTIDLSSTLDSVVFAPLKDEKFFQKVYIGDYGQIAWSDDIEICSDAAYLEITMQLESNFAHA